MGGQSPSSWKVICDVPFFKCPGHSKTGACQISTGPGGGRAEHIAAICRVPPSAGGAIHGGPFLGGSGRETITGKDSIPDLDENYKYQEKEGGRGAELHPAGPWCSPRRKTGDIPSRSPHPPYPTSNQWRNGAQGAPSSLLCHRSFPGLPVIWHTPPRYTFPLRQTV